MLINYTNRDLRTFIDDLAIKCLSQGIIVYNVTRHGLNGDTFTASSIDLPYQRSIDRLSRRVQLFHQTDAGEYDKFLPSYTAALCQVLTAEIAPNMYFAWYPSGEFCGLYYLSHINVSAFADVTIQEYALTQNISLESAAERFLYPVDESRSIRPLNVRSFSDYFFTVATCAASYADNPEQSIRIFKNQIAALL